MDEKRLDFYASGHNEYCALKGKLKTSRPEWCPQIMHRLRAVVGVVLLVLFCVVMWFSSQEKAFRPRLRLPWSRPTYLKKVTSIKTNKIHGKRLTPTKDDTTR